jgi:hypothetical protein
MTKLTMHWRVGDNTEPGAHFFLYREGDEVHCDHRLYSRDELQRRVGAILSASGEVPSYYVAALTAFEDPLAPRAGAEPVQAVVAADGGHR